MTPIQLYWLELASPWLAAEIKIVCRLGRQLATIRQEADTEGRICAKFGMDFPKLASSNWVNQAVS